MALKAFLYGNGFALLLTVLGKSWIYQQVLMVGLSYFHHIHGYVWLKLAYDGQ